MKRSKIEAMAASGPSGWPRKVVATARTDVCPSTRGTDVCRPLRGNSASTFVLQAGVVERRDLIPHIAQQRNRKRMAVGRPGSARRRIRVTLARWRRGRFALFSTPSRRGCWRRDLAAEFRTDRAGRHRGTKTSARRPEAAADRARRAGRVAPSSVLVATGRRSVNGLFRPWRIRQGRASEHGQGPSHGAAAAIRVRSDQ